MAVPAATATRRPFASKRRLWPQKLTLVKGVLDDLNLSDEQKAIAPAVVQGG
jgi:hypothetical protein